MSLTTAADRLADLEERLLAAGSNLERHHQIVQARRRVVWAGQWVTRARIASADGDALLEEAATHLRRCLSTIDKELVS